MYRELFENGGLSDLVVQNSCHLFFTNSISQHQLQVHNNASYMCVYTYSDTHARTHTHTYTPIAGPQ